jgi:hypothetical protein
MLVAFREGDVFKNIFIVVVHPKGTLSIHLTNFDKSLYKSVANFDPEVRSGMQ